MLEEFDLSYCAKLGEWGSVFAVPSSVVDKHIKLVGSAQLKVLLWILRNSDKNFSENDISNSLSIHEEDVKDAIGYWIETGVLNLKKFDLVLENDKAEENFVIKKLEPEKEKRKEDFRNNDVKDKTVSVTRMLKPDGSYIVERIKSSQEISFLMQEAQIILGRPISTGDSAVLLMLLDNEGLPIDVILMIMQYAVGIGKGNMRYIEAVGISWAKEEIDTIEKAEKKIKSLSETMKAWKNFEQIIGGNRQPTAREEEAVYRWQKIWNFNMDMLKEAYEICINSNGKYVLKYIDSIISRWHKEGINNISQVHKERTNLKKIFKSEKDNPSYSIDKYENYNILDEINWGLKRMTEKNEV